MEEYKKFLTIASADADSRCNYKAYSFMCAAQEIANNHATSLGFGYNQFIERNIAWVLSRMKVRFIRSPKWLDDVSLTTWHKGISGLFSLRDFEVRSAKDESVLIAATSSWLIINLETRRMLRTDHAVAQESYISSVVRKNAIDCECEKLISPIDLKGCGTHTVQYSDIDFNHHVNNAKYIEWAFDCIDPGILLSKDIDGYQINFNHEAKLGDVIDLSISSPHTDSFFVEGRRGDDNIFQTIIKLKP